MAQYTVHLSRVDSIAVTVEADDDEAAVDAARDMVPDLCANCAGYNKPWSVDVDDETELEAVIPVGGGVGWRSPERWSRIPTGTS